MIRGFALVVLAATAGTAQPRTGDWVLSDFVNRNTLVCVEPATGRLSTLLAPRPDGYLNAVAMATDNRHVMTLLTGKGTDALLRVSPAGRVQTQVVFPPGGRPNGIALEESGDFLVCSTDANLYRVGGFSIVATIATGTRSTLNAVTIDVDTGDPVVGTFFGPGHLLRIDATTRALSTIATGFAYVTGIAWLPHSGDFVVTTGQGPQVRIVSRQGQLVRTLPFYVASHVRADARSGGFVVCGGSRVTRFDATGTALESHDYPGHNFSGVEIYGSRPISGAGSMRPGSIYWLRLEFPDAPRGTFAVALASAVRPGVVFPGIGRLDLEPDALFRATFAGLAGFTSNFIGALDSLGRDFARIDVPTGTPPGTRVFASAFVWSSRGCFVGNTVGMTVRP